MRWSIVRLIWLREMRDQLRDRRTVFMIAVLPVLLYPVGGFGVMQLALGHLGKQSVVGVQGGNYLPSLTPRCVALSPAPALSWLAAAPTAPGAPLAGIERASAAAAFDLARRSDPYQDYPPLFLSDGEDLHFPSLYLDSPDEAKTLVLRSLDAPPPPLAADGRADDFLTRIDRSALDNRQVDLLLVVPANFLEILHRNGRPPLYVLRRDDDERARLVQNRLNRILRNWKLQLKDVRLLRQGLPADFDEVIEVRTAGSGKPANQHAADELLEMLVRIFPFILVMWSLAGALYPAVDLCAGEKERGTMETLLISPAGRAEIVYGKFLTIWVFSGATALLNLTSIGLTTWHFGKLVAVDASFRPAALFWAVALLLPLSAFFSAVCLAIGAYARSSKEGQYYLMPLFLITLPLILLTLAPGVELNHFYSMIPVTGVALLLQKLMAIKPPDSNLWGYFLPVLVPMLAYSWLALRWAIEQFQREEVLFREAERLDLNLWLRRLFREKEPLPSVGQAFFCFAMILGLHWLLLAGSGRVSLVSYNAVRYLAFVASPPLFMAVLLTTQPVQGLALRWPAWWAWPVGAALAVLLLPPFSALTLLLLNQFPHIKQAAANGLTDAVVGPQAIALLVFVILPALCEELAFRGFILSGLRRRFAPWTAILLSSFLYALYQMNVLQALPHFLLGVVLAMLVVRSGSLGGAIVFRLVWEWLLWGPVLRQDWLPNVDWLNAGAVLVCLILAVPLLSFLRPPVKNSLG